MLKKITLLVTTGMPGLHRLLAFTIIEAIFGIMTLGKFSNDYFFIQILIIFTSMGLTGLLMIKLPKLTDDSIAIYMSRTVMTFVLFSIFVIPIVYLLNLLSLLYMPFGALLLLVGMGGNLIIRYYYLSLKQYEQVLLYDIFVTILLLVILPISFVNFSPIVVIALIYLSSFILFLMVNLRKRNIFFTYFIISYSDIRKSLEITIINFLSAGVYFLLIPIVNKKLGVEYAGLIGVISVLSSMMLLIPRALTLYFLPDLSRTIKDKFTLNNKYRIFFNINILALIFLFLSSLIVLVFLKNYVYVELFNLENSINLYILFMFSVLISQLSLPMANLLLAVENLNMLTKINFLLALFYSFGYLIISIYCSSNLYFVYMCMGMIVIGNMLRFLILSYHVKNILN